jgi:hypothetical protein
VLIGVGGTNPVGPSCCPCAPDIRILALIDVELQLYSYYDVFHGPISMICSVSLVP